MPLISVVVPVYKVEPYIRRCVDSILRQSFEDFELILVDDGSPDNCGAICDEYAYLDSRIHVIHKPNGGLSAARNAALDWMFVHSSSEYVTFIDSDDWISNNYFKEMVQGVRLGHQIACVEFNLVTKDKNSSYEAVPHAMWRSASPEDYWVHLGKFCTTACGKLFERDFFKVMRFPVGKIHEDEFTTYLAVFSATTIAYLPSPLYNYLKRDGSITSSGWTEAEFDFIEALLQQIGYFARIDAKEAEMFTVNRLTRVYSDAIIKGRHTELRRSLRQLLFDYRIPVLTNERIYRVAFPIRMKWQWPILRLNDVLKRRGPLGAFRQWSSRFLFNGSWANDHMQRSFAKSGKIACNATSKR